MSESIIEKIKQSLHTADSLYHRLVLLVSEAGFGKTAVLQEIADDFESSIININLTLSKGLLEQTAKQRSLRVPEILNQIVDKAQSPVILDNIEILFDKDLKLDPLRLLQIISRNHTVVASWNGAYIGGSLIYAETGHAEYRRYDSINTLIVSMD